MGATDIATMPFGLETRDTAKSHDARKFQKVPALARFHDYHGSRCEASGVRPNKPTAVLCHPGQHSVDAGSVFVLSKIYWQLVIRSK